MDLGNVTGPDGNTQNVGGATGRWRISDINTMTTIQKKIELNEGTATAPEDLINISGNHAWAVGEGYYEIYCTRDEGEGKATGPKVRDASGMESVMTAKFPGIDPANLGVCVIANNTKVIAWQELADGTWLQYGSERFPAEFQYDWTSGKNSGTRRETTVTVSAFDTTPAIYLGTFTAHP